MTSSDVVTFRPVKALACAAFVAVFATMVTVASAQQTNLVLPQIEERLRPVLAELTPPPTLEYPPSSQSLLVYFRPQNFMVHGRFMTGEWSSNAVEEVGPSFTGFVLRAHLQGLGEVNQAVTPQTIEEPYWRTSLEVTPVAGSTNQIFWAISSGSRTDPQVLAKLRQVMESLGCTPKKAAAEPTGASRDQKRVPDFHPPSR